MKVISTAKTPPALQWDATFSGVANANLQSIIPTKDGNFLLFGGVNGGQGADNSAPSHGYTDYWVMKIDANGNKLWDKTFGGIDSEDGSSLVATPDGGFLLGGSSASNQAFDKSSDSYGGFDYWVVKISADGVKQWDKTFGGSGSDLLQSIIITSAGGILLGGSSESGQSGFKSAPLIGVIDYWVVKLDANGNKLWDKTFGGEAYDGLTSLIATPDGGFLLGGSSSSNQTFDKSSNSRGEYDYWVVKINDNGIKQWDKTFGGSGSDELQSIITTSDGGFLLGGSSESGQSGEKSAASRGSKDYWVVKIGLDGNKLWDKSYGGTEFDFFSSLTIAQDGGFLLGGSSFSNQSGEKSENSRGLNDYWVVKTNASGDKQWDKTIGGDNFDNQKCLTATTDGGFILGGSTRSSPSGDKSKSGSGMYHWWIVKRK